MIYFGVWAQPTASFKKWKDAGCNLIFPDVTEPIAPAAKRAAAKAAGLLVIDTPQGATPAELLADATNLLNDSNVLAISLGDEPDLYAPFFASDPVAFQKFVSDWKAKWAPVIALAKGKRPLYCNVAGPHVVQARPDDLKAQGVAPFLTDADIISMDLYPIATNAKQLWDDWNAGIGLTKSSYQHPEIPDPLAVNSTFQTYALRILKGLFPGRRYGAYIEVDKFDDSPAGRSPTPDEIQKQVDTLLAEGCEFIVAFTDKFNGPGWSNPAAGPGGSNWDGETPEEFAKLSEIAKKLTSGGSVGSSTDSSDFQLQLNNLNKRIEKLESLKIPTGVQLTF